MKKAVPLVVVLAAIAAALFIYFKRSRGTMDLAPGFAAELAPAETVLFIEVPDVARTEARWAETGLHKIAQEPEWREFTAKWDDFVAQNPAAREVFGVFGEVKRADPAGLFVALTDFDANGPKLVGGFPYRGRKGDVESVVKKLREQIVKAYPAATSEVTDYQGVAVETLKDLKFTAAMAYQDNWFFFATETELLLKTLSRYAKNSGAEASLSKDSVFMSSAVQGSEDPDLRLWARWSFFGDKLNALGMMSGQALPDIKDPNPVQAVTYTWKLDGPLMRDRMFFQTANPLKVEPYANRSIAFTNPATYAYIGMSLAGLEDYTQSLLQTFGAMGVSQAANQALAPNGVKLEDVFATFGPEISLMSAWEPGGITLPDFFAAVEVKDSAKARAFAEFLAAQMATSGEPATSLQGETTIWTTASDVPFFKPSLALNQQHLMFGLNPAALNAGIKQLAEKAPNLATYPGSPYPAALETVVAPTAMIFYLDTKTLFERLYDKVKPMIAFSLVGNPEAGKHFDAAKLPQAASISQHLAPMIVSYGAGEKGWVVEGTGTVTFMSVYVMAMPAALIGVRQAMPAQGPALQRGGATTAPVPPPPQGTPPPVSPLEERPPQGAQPPSATSPAPSTTPDSPANPPKSVPVPGLLLPRLVK